MSSDRNRRWTLARELSHDYFDFRSEAPASLLLIAMHLSDGMPWISARNPLYLDAAVSAIDNACKRILGKRYRDWSALSEAEKELPLSELDTWGIIDQKLRVAGHDFQSPTVQWPELKKEPGKLLPRQLTASVKVEIASSTYELRSRNFTEISQCLHAELTLIAGLSRQLSLINPERFPINNLSFECTLKPCRMCASFLHSLRRHCKVFAVRYHEDDPGPLAQNTALDQHGYHSP